MKKQKRLDDSMPGIFEKVAESIVKNWKPRRGETVGWIGCPDIKSEIIGIKTYRKGHKRERYYYLKNNLNLTIDEMIKL